MGVAADRHLRNLSQCAVKLIYGKHLCRNIKMTDRLFEQGRGIVFALETMRRGLTRQFCFNVRSDVDND